MRAFLAAAVAWASLACVTAKERSQPLRQLPAPHIDKLLPSTTIAGKGFQIQPSGDSAIAVLGANLVTSSRVCFDGVPAVTAYGGATCVTALVPPEVYRQAGAVRVTVRNGDGQVSNAVTFSVLPGTP